MFALLQALHQSLRMATALMGNTLPLMSLGIAVHISNALVLRGTVLGDPFFVFSRRMVLLSKSTSDHSMLSSSPRLIAVSIATSTRGAS